MSIFVELCQLNESKKFLQEKGFTRPTEIQSKAIPEIRGDMSLEIFSPTGSGKTLSYLIPLCEKFKIKEKAPHDKSKMKGPSLLVLAPTRELAKQIAKEAKDLAHHLKLKVRTLDGPSDIANIRSKGCDLLIGVAGNVSSAVKKKAVSLNNLLALVLDEADQMLEGGFKKELVEISKDIRRLNLNSQIILMSATEGETFVELRKEIFGDMAFKKITSQVNHLLPQIDTFNIFVSIKEKMPMTLEFLKKEAKGQGIIFVNKKEEIEEIYNQIQQAFPLKKINFIHGGMGPKERDKAYQSFLEEGEILVASDIMARGIDLVQAQWVFNYDLPFEAVYYIHRAGRVGRGGKKGQVYNLVTAHDSDIISRINSAIHHQTALKLTAIKDRYKETNKEKKHSGDPIMAVKKNRRPGSKGSFKSTPRYARKNTKSKRGGGTKAK